MTATGSGRLRRRRLDKERTSSDGRATYREVIALSEFRALWFAQGLSLLGDQFAQVALGVLVYQRTESPLVTAVVYALTYLPPIVGGPLLAGLADRYARRRVMVVCDVARAALVAADGRAGHAARRAVRAAVRRDDAERAVLRGPGRAAARHPRRATGTWSGRRCRT